MGRTRTSTCGTRWAGLCAALLLAGSAGADEDLSVRAEATLGAQFYDLDKPFDDDDLTSFFDQYRPIRNKDADLPWRMDVLHLDAGLEREDGTHLLRLERTSPEWRAERMRLDLGWRGLRLDARAHRIRNDELRVYPEDTGDAALIPVFPTQFNPDAAGLGRDEKFLVRRTGGRAELRLRPEDFGYGLPGLDQVTAFAGYEQRKGHRQDRFLLDDTEASGAQTSRFRAFRRDLDQVVRDYGGGIVFSPFDLVTGALDVRYVRFRERNTELVQSDLAALDPAIGAVAAPLDSRAFFHVPDTNRLSGRLRLSRRVGDASFHGGAFATVLEQSGKGPTLQRIEGIRDGKVTTLTWHGAFDVPLRWGLALSGHAKWLRRDNGLDEDAFDAFSSDGEQVGVFLRDSRELDAELELSARPIAGSLLAAGIRTRQIHRNLRFGDDASPGSIQQPFVLVNDESERYTAYLRGRVRLLRSLRLGFEGGYEWAPQIGMARELEDAAFLKTRGSWTLPFRRTPLTLSFFGDARHGSNDDVVLAAFVPSTGTFDPDRTREKKFQRVDWRYGFTLTAAPLPELVTFASFVHARDQQEFAHVRSNIARFNYDPGFATGNLGFYLDSEPNWDSELQTLVGGTTWNATDRIDASVTSSVTWVRARFRDDGPTAQALERGTAIRSRILSLDARLGFVPRDGVRLELGYRLDDFGETRQLDPLPLDADRHTFTIAVTLDWPALLD